MLVERKAHRIWIVNHRQKLLGVITLTDLLCKVYGDIFFLLLLFKATVRLTKLQIENSAC
jgi:CBS domain-containing protein